MHRDHLFAVLDDDSTRFKIVHLKERYSNGFKHTLTPYTPTNDEIFELNWLRARDTDTNLQQMTLPDGTLFLWRTPWAICHKNAWLPILDSDNLARIPGEFMYVGSPNHSRMVEYKQLHANMMTRLYGTQFQASPSPTPSAPPQSSIPSFVANIMKQDAIRNKYNCPISMEAITDTTNTTLTSCYHIFEADSLNNWLKRSNVCPICKAPVAFTVLCKN